MFRQLLKLVKVYIITCFICIFHLNIAHAIQAESSKMIYSFENATSLRINNVFCDGKIITDHELESVEIVINGSKESLESLIITNHNQQINIQYDDKYKSRANKSVYIQIRAPQHLKFYLDIINGNWDISNLKNNLHLNVIGSGDVYITEIDAEELRIISNGSSSIHTKRGHVKTLDIKITGSSTIEFGGAANSASFQILGSGKIIVNKVLDQIIHNTIYGSGRIKITNDFTDKNKNAQ